MGKTGSGKSSVCHQAPLFCGLCTQNLGQFINSVAGKNIAGVGHGLESMTSDVVAFDIDYKGQKLTLVDTPGFDDYRESTIANGPPLSNEDVLRKIAEYMRQTWVLP